MLTTIIIGLFLVPLIVYLINFHSHPISDNPTDWGTFGDYIGGLSGAMIAIAGIVITYEFNQTSLKKQENSLRPLAYIYVEDFENRIYVGIKNAGLGPLLIMEFRVTNTAGQTINNIMDFMPDLPENYFWTNFFGNPIGFVIKEGTDMVLLEIEATNLSLDGPDLAGEEANLTEDFYINAFSDIRDRIRQSLSELTVELDYEDIYENKMPTVQRKLDWFARNIRQTQTQ